MIHQLTKEIENKTTVEQLQILAKKFAGKIAFSTSFGQEDRVITDMIFTNNIPITVFTLDTGRFFPETYKVWQKTLEKYPGKVIKTYFPNNQEVEKMMTEKGTFSFYDSIDNRKECCNIRKVFPLQRALAKYDLWITGLRAEQSVTRTDLALLEENKSFNVVKFNPLTAWTLEQTQDYLKVHNVPENELHAQGFVSIGCQPCTRAIKPGDDIRAGRWWWESKDKKECGLHVEQPSEIKFKIGKI